MNPIITLISEHLVSFYIGIAFGFVVCFILLGALGFYLAFIKPLYHDEEDSDVFAYDEGYDAFLACKTTTDNPYKRFTKEHGEWATGHMQALIDQDITVRVDRNFLKADERMAKNEKS